MVKKETILIIMGRYLPGYKDGGPVRSIKNLTDYLGDEYNFKILTCDRDHGDKKPYDGVNVNAWNRVGKVDVYYVPPGNFKITLIYKLAKEVDLIYLCGCFNDYAVKTLLLKRIGKIHKTVVVAAMGLFSPMEFRLKYWKKKAFIMLFNFSGMFQKIYWSATSELEINEICQQVKAKKEQFYIAEDLPRKVDDRFIQKEKKSGELEVVWISRIAPKKNLMAAISILQKVSCKVHFVIYGPIHVEEYWKKCLEQLKKLPSNVTWEQKGIIDSEAVVDTLKKYHVFLFPTLGENYGHVIQEALSAGCPCILSNQTPWTDLEANGCGYVFDLEDIGSFVSVIEKYSAMGEKEFCECSNAAVRYVAAHSNNKVKNTGYRDIFQLGKDM